MVSIAGMGKWAERAILDICSSGAGKFIKHKQIRAGGKNYEPRSAAEQHNLNVSLYVVQCIFCDMNIKHKDDKSYPCQ